MFKPLLTFVLMLTTAGLFAQAWQPKVHSSIMLDAKFYSGDTANQDNYDTTNRYQVRKATLSLQGQLTDRMNYTMEAGVSTCSGAGDQLKLLDAELMYELAPDLHIGLKQGHVLRGFSAKTECPARLALEKPVFAQTFATCHPQGVVLSKYAQLGNNMAIELELAAMNGANGTLDGEHDYNAGMILDTPITGLSVGGSYNHVANNYYDAQFEKYSKDGYRYVAGLNYLKNGVWLTGEYYQGEGFSRDDQKMNAWYGQAGYQLPVGIGQLQAVQPYARYEFWDKDQDADQQNDYAYMEYGTNFKVSAYTMLRAAYRCCVQKPDGQIKEPASFIVRLQTGF